MQEMPVIAEVRQGALWITLNRPAAMNAITPDVVRGIEWALDEATKRDDVRVVVLTGAGRAFCAGADLKFVRGERDGDQSGGSRFLDALLALLNRLERFPRPVIAAVNGMALAGGLELVLCCDLVIAGKSARFGDAHANYGLLPGGGGSVRLPRKIGATRAKYLMYTGEFVTAEAMESAGLVNQVVEDAQLRARVDALVQTMAAKSPLGLSRMKLLVNDGLEQPAEVALRQELLMIALHEHSEDLREGLAAFQEKRSPQFTGL
ncbi:enoyl-CoA hydratase [Paraburkholderia ginsengiterrae]|uniref:Enoyl-CoA hydratase n=1 Tax=Paraburkholderia ginsengiterrae TaxID=1462993 RepID=A0A1A9N8Y5_9BURK|nr:enoyl-CoA hydratase/isomerase family protein [Paraburkholderia ginsengiterrae]OAJ51627.1 enoyl-CoA hydratase [Paraburkholderia ginsengiterrae]OAJ61814.1 enoyl-CoA hydratase [Paraburkholderia ginsengiterrae]